MCNHLLRQGLLLLFTCYSVALIAQSGFDYTSLQDVETTRNSLLQATKKRYEADVASLSGSNKKYLADIYSDRYHSLEKHYNDSSIVTDTKAEQYLNNILKEIVTGNPALQPLNMRVAFSREYYPNASCSGEGTILFNIGLFSRLHNESEAAFVLCHELSHQYLDHVNRHIAQYVNTLYSDDFQHKLKEIKNTEYQKRQLLEQTVQNISFSTQRHSREHEAEADSMALIFLKNTHYNISSTVTCLALLDSVDSDKYNVSPKPDSLFNSAAYPFQPSWGKQQTGFFSQLAQSSLDETANERDSLKTHPDCPLRIRYMRREEAGADTTKGVRFLVTDSATFVHLQRTFDFEIVNYTYQSNHVSRSLYYSMQMLQSYPGNAFLVANIGRCFNKMYDAQKKHEFGLVTDYPSPYAEKKYNDFLQFLQRLRLSDIAAINYHFLTAYNSSFASYKPFTDAYSKSKELFSN